MSANGEDCEFVLRQKRGERVTTIAINIMYSLKLCDIKKTYANIIPERYIVNK